MTDAITDLLDTHLSTWQLPEGFFACGRGVWRRAGQRWFSTLSCRDAGGKTHLLTAIADLGSLQPVRVLDALGYNAFGSPGATTNERDAGAALALQADSDCLTWADPDTGLIWMRYAMRGYFTWDQAMAEPASFNQSRGCAGWSDWRLPTNQELLGLVKPKDHLGRPFQADAFPEMAEAIDEGIVSWLEFWSASSLAEDPTKACRVCFRKGACDWYDKSQGVPIRLVRDAR